MAVLDTSFLIYLFDPDVNPPIDPGTNQPVSHCKERVEYLVKGLEQNGENIIIPTPALSEYLVHARDAGVERLRELQNKGVVKLKSFDVLAAVELATLHHEALSRGDKSAGVEQAWQKIKFDHQIVAIAKVHKETTIYSNDQGLHKIATKAKLNPYALYDLDIPPEDTQQKLEFSDAENKQN